VPGGKLNNGFVSCCPIFPAAVTAEFKTCAQFCVGELGPAGVELVLVEALVEVLAVLVVGL
jgi:hypothetical protein